MTDSHILAALPFVTPSRPGRAGALLLLTDGTLQIAPSPELWAELEETGAQVDVAALKWGSTLIVGSAAVGACLYPTRLRPLAWLCFAVSGGVGYLGRRLRRAGQRWSEQVLARHPADSVRVREAGGGLSVAIPGAGDRLMATVFRLEPGEFSAFEAAAFLAAWEGLVQRTAAGQGKAGNSGE